jgi:hypothetical protein
MMKLGYKQKRLTVTLYSSIYGTKKLMIFTNTNKTIYAAAVKCYKMVIIWGRQIIC